MLTDISEAVVESDGGNDHDIAYRSDDGDCDGPYLNEGVDADLVSVGVGEP